MAKRITNEEVYELFEKWKTPAHVIAHCKAVSNVGVILAETLNLHGYNLDVDLVRGTGLAHDVARVYKDHGGVGCGILKELGYDDEAEIIRVHMHYLKFNSVDNINECDIVCLADKLVIEDKYVGLDKRFEYIINKAHAGEDINKIIRFNRDRLREFIKDIEKLIGQTFDELFCEL